MKSICLYICFLFILLSCGQRQQQAESSASQPLHPHEDLADIRADGILTAVTLYSSTTYFQYKMQPMGYEYDMIEDFARSEGLKLEIKVAQNGTDLLRMLDEGEADVVAYPILISNRNKQKYLYCGQEEQSCQVLVQRANKEDSLLTDVTQMVGKDIYIKQHSRYGRRLENLDQELGGGLRIHYIESDSITSEDLIMMVSKGEIPYTVCDENVARLNRTYYWNIDTQLKISFMQRSSWVVRKSSPELARAINEWASDTNRKRSFNAITKRYYELSKQTENAAPQPTIPAGHISPYDELFRKHAHLLDWDWRLLAAISYQESKFDPTVVSWAGAEGLMGIMPNTAKALGVMPHELKDPDMGIRTGVDCLRRLRQGFSSITNPEEVIKFTLASYNADIGHVYDARRLAEKYGKNPDVWEHNVADFIRLKSDPEYYNDPVCQHGYLRGSETFNYVREIMQRYHEYCLATEPSAAQ